MLVLSRKAGQEILIGDDISIVVNKVSGDRVSLGIKAPRNVRVLRGELKKSADVDQQAGFQLGSTYNAEQSSEQVTA